jgi:hypothetical protein
MAIRVTDVPKSIDYYLKNGYKHIFSRDAVAFIARDGEIIELMPNTSEYVEHLAFVTTDLDTLALLRQFIIIQMREKFLLVKSHNSNKLCWFMVQDKEFPDQYIQIVWRETPLITFEA